MIERDAVQRGIGSPSHLLRATAIDIRGKSPAILKFRDPRRARRSFARHGAVKFLILDGGVSTHYPLTILSYDLHNELGIEVAVTDIRGLGAETAREVCVSGKGGHADDGETSCLLAVRPDLVNMAAAHGESAGGAYVTAGPTGIHKITLKTNMGGTYGVNGDPSAADAEKGGRILDAMARDILVFLRSFSESSHA